MLKGTIIVATAIVAAFVFGTVYAAQNLGMTLQFREPGNCASIYISSFSLKLPFGYSWTMPVTLIQ